MMMDSKIILFVLLFNDRVGDNVSTIQKSEAKESKNVFFETVM